MASYKTGPLAGIEYRTERQKRNAREWLLRTGEILQPADVPASAGGLYSQATTRRRREREQLEQRGAATLGITLDEMASNKEYFRIRWARQLASESRRSRRGRVLEVEDTYQRLKNPNSPFEKTWREAVRQGFDPKPGSAFDRLTQGAGMMTGYGGEKQGHYARSHYLQYLEWLMARDAMEDIGSAEPTANVA